MAESENGSELRGALLPSPLLSPSILWFTKMVSASPPISIDSAAVDTLRSAIQGELVLPTGEE